MGIAETDRVCRECILSWGEAGRAAAVALERTAILLGCAGWHARRAGIKGQPRQNVRYPAMDQANWPSPAALASLARTCAPSAVTSNRPVEDRTARLWPSGAQTSAFASAFCGDRSSPRLPRRCVQARSAPLTRLPCQRVALGRPCHLAAAPSGRAPPRPGVWPGVTRRSVSPETTAAIVAEGDQ